MFGQAERNVKSILVNNKELKRKKKKIIQHYQERLMPAIQGCFNVWNSIKVIHHVNRIKQKSPSLMRTDTKEAFDKIQHP